MFSAAVSVGIRLKAWNTNPTRSRRSRVSSRSSSDAEVGVADEHLRRRSSVSSPARQCISVDLPEPDGPMIAVKRPAGKSTVTPSRARDRRVARAVDLDGVDGPGGDAGGGGTGAVRVASCMAAMVARQRPSPSSALQASSGCAVDGTAYVPRRRPERQHPAWPGATRPDS